jgi:hypothetical protein
VDGSTVFQPSGDGVMWRNPQDVYTEVLYGWQGGDPVYASSAATAAAFGLTRTGVTSSALVGKLATAQASAVAWLNIHNAEQDIYSTTLTLPSAAVNLALAGQEISVTLSHVPGYESGVVGRIRNRTARLVVVGWWEVDLEIWFPTTPATDADVVTSVCSYVAAPYLGYTAEDQFGGKVFWDGTYSAPGSPPAYTTDNTGLAPSLYGTPDNGSAWGISPTVFGPGTVDVRWKFDLGSPIAMCTTQLIWLSGTGYSTFWLQSSDDGSTWTDELNYSAGTAVSITTTAHRYWALRNTLTVGFGYYPGEDIMAFLIWPETVQTPIPTTGVGVVSETAGGTVNNSNADFTTTYPWVPGTLVVLVDGTDQTSHISAEDPAAGTFTLDWGPAYGDLVTVNYTAA